MTTKEQIRIIDTHCHLAQEEYAKDLNEVILEFTNAGVAAISSAIDPSNYEANLSIAQQHPNIYAALGLDPADFQKTDDAIAKILNHIDEIVAIGEVGVDHYIIRDHKHREQQEHAFRRFIKLAAELDLPIQVHSRSAGRKAVEILRDMEAEQVHMHAFDGKSSIARTASTDYGYYFSIPTSVVRSPQKQKLVRAVDIERLLVETDSPVLGPMRGERNEPANVWVALDKVSEILHRDMEELAEIILENTYRLYGRNMLR